jgi:hypothetical protein
VVAAFLGATAYYVLRSARLLELPSARLLGSVFSSALLLHVAYISTSTANCIHQYNYCIVLQLQDNYDYLLPAAFISTFTATAPTFISTSTATCIHQYKVHSVWKFRGTMKKVGTSSVGSGTVGKLLALLTNV